MDKLIVSTSPHIRTKISTQNIMRDVLIALSPAAVASVIFFGLRALLLMAVCVATAVLSEFLFNLIVKKEQTIKDLSAAVTGLILALSLPVKAEIWQCIVGSVFAIVVVKCLFGGIGCNFANPAVTGRVMLFVSFSSVISGGSATVFMKNSGTVDAVAGATPLQAIKDGSEALPTLLDMFLGNRGGAIGETCAIALILGFIYLVVRKVIHWEIPVIFIGTVFVLSTIIEGSFNLGLYHLLGGGLLFGAIFMATDYVTSPINRLGKMVFAFGCGIFTVVFRFLSSMPEGVSYAILIMNILSPYIEKLTERKPLGKGGRTK